MYEVIVILKALTEVAGVAFLGQGVLWELTGAKRDNMLTSHHNKCAMSA